MKCDICKKKIEETFLTKLVGTYIKDAKGKKHTICKDCQSQYKDKTTLLTRI